MRTIDQVIASLPVAPCERLPAPLYAPKPKQWDEGAGGSPRLGLAVESMSRHMTSEGWELFRGLESAGYGLMGYNIPAPSIIPGEVKQDGFTDVQNILDYYEPAVVVIQDKREWTGKTAGGPARGWDERERFRNVEALRDRADVFKVTVLKDAQSDRALHVEAAQEAGIHAWVCYYHPRIVSHLCPWVREEHLVRTWHSVDAGLVPSFSAEGRSGCLLSGALGLAYPLRTRLAHAVRTRKVQGIDWLPHPSYHRRGCATPDYLKTLSRYKVAVCTSSVYGYALRKIIEATACGCRVITDLPVDEELPGGIDENVRRVEPDWSVDRIKVEVDYQVSEWDHGLSRQAEYADRAKRWYDYRAVGRRLAEDIETLRRNYRCP